MNATPPSIAVVGAGAMGTAGRAWVAAPLGAPARAVPLEGLRWRGVAD